MATGNQPFFVQALERWDNTAWGMVAVPLGLFLVGSVVLFFACKCVERLSRRLSPTYAGLTESSFAWVRRVGIVLLLCLCLGLALENVSEFLLDGRTREAGGLLRSSGLQLRKFSRVVVKSTLAGTRFAFVVLAALWICRFLEEAVRVFFSRDKGLRVEENSENRTKVRLETLRTTSTYVVRLVVAVVAVLVCMQTVGLSIAPLIATAGVASVAIGLGAQTLIRDVVAGFFVIVEDQYAVGDVIDLGTRGGMVESMTLRVTKLRGSDGSAIFIPNGEIKMVRNTTSEWARVDFRVRVRLQEDLPRVEALLQDVLASIATDMPGDVTAKPEYLGVDKLEEKYAVLRAWVRTRPLSRHRVERELNARVLRAFGTHDVQFPTT